MSRKINYFYTTIFGIFLILIGLFSDLVRGRVLSLGWLQISLILVGIVITLYSLVCLLINNPWILDNLSKLNTKFAENISPWIPRYSWISILIIVGIIILFIWPKPEVYASPDVAYYLSLAKNLFHSAGYVYPDLSPAIYRGPIFPLLISLSYRLFGESLVSALVMVRIFWVIALAFAYLLGRDLFNKKVGIISVILIGTVSVISENYGFILTDAVLASMMMVSLWLIWKSMTADKPFAVFLLTGLVMGLTYLIKQSIIVFLPVPILIWLISPILRNKKMLLKVLAIYLIFGTFYFGWMGYVFLAGGSRGQILGDLNQVVTMISYIPNSISNLFAGNPVQAEVMDRSASIIAILFSMVQQYFTKYIPYSILFIPALIVNVYYAFFRKNLADQFILIVLALYSLLIPSTVVIGFGTRFYLLFYFILIISLTAAISRLSIPRFQYIFQGLMLISIVLLVVIQLVNQPMRISSFATRTEELKFFAEYQNIASWIDRNIDPADRILVKERDDNRLHYLTDGNRMFYAMEFCRGENSFHPVKACKPPFIYLWINGGITHPTTPRDYMLGLAYSDLKDQLINNKIKYLIVSPMIQPMNSYFATRQGYSKAVEMDGFTVYKVDLDIIAADTSPVNTCLGSSMTKYLTRLIEDYPQKFHQKLITQYTPWMGLTEADLLAFSKWTGCTVNIK